VGSAGVRPAGVPQAPRTVVRVALLCPDLLFGSKLQGALRAGGHEPVGPDDLADVLVVDLTSDSEERIAVAADSELPTLAFYSHVEQHIRERAEAAGIDRVVPRSRMAREPVALVESLLE
jgi:hypothetical protein